MRSSWQQRKIYNADSVSQQQISQSCYDFLEMEVVLCVFWTYELNSFLAWEWGQLDELWGQYDWAVFNRKHHWWCPWTISHTDIVAPDLFYQCEHPSQTSTITSTRTNLLCLMMPLETLSISYCIISQRSFGHASMRLLTGTSIPSLYAICPMDSQTVWNMHNAYKDVQ